MSAPSTRQPIHESTPKVVAVDALSQQQPTVLASPIHEAAAAPNSDQPRKASTPNRLPAGRTSVPEEQGQRRNGTQSRIALLLWDPVLQTLAAGLDDIEATRIAQASRLRILTTTDPDSDGLVRGFGLSEEHPAVVALDAQLKTLEFLDKSMTKALEKQLRLHPLYPWVEQRKMLGAKSAARLMAAVRDPYWNDLHDRPRTVGELFRFCGVAGPGQGKRRGQKIHHSPEAKKRVHIIALGMVKNRTSAYRAVYDDARAEYVDKTHTEACAQCGVKGTPAVAGSDWRDGHKHMAALRKVKREILRDLWATSRAIYIAHEATL